MNNQKELTALRDRILKDVMPLVLNSAENNADRFSVLLRVIQAGNAGMELYQRAYESAQKIEDATERLNALLSIVDEIDFDVSPQASTATAPEQEAPQNRPADLVRSAAESSVEPQPQPQPEQ